MPWRQVLVALICTSLTVRSSPCSWVVVLSSWSQGYKAVLKLQMEETVDHWDVDVEFSESVINFEAWKGHVNKISDTSYTVSNTCYNNIVYSCQCFELPYLVRHEPMWVGNTTFKFNGDVVPACDPPFCDDSSSSGEANTTSTTSPADNQATTETEMNSNLNVVNNILNDLTSLGRIRYKRQSNDFTKDENELLDTLAEYTTYLKNECSTISGNCQSKTLATYGSKLNAIIQKIKKSGGISSGFLDAFKEKRDEVIEATETADRIQSEKKEKICMANGRPCVFPFKDDAGKEHNTCADYKGRYFWCATRVNSKGKYISWEKCPKGGRCDVPNEEKATTKKTTTTTTTTTTKTKQGVSCMAGSKPCVFPFKNDDGTGHNECADYKGRYLWCATAVNSKGTYTTWGKCTECKDPNTSPSTPGDCSCTDYINKKGYGDCKKGHPDFNNAEICYVKLPSTCSDLRESKTDPGKMASAEACKKDDSCCQELDLVSTGAAFEHQGARLGSYKKQVEENDGKPVYLQEGAVGNYLFYRETFGWLISRQGPQSTSEGGIMSDSEADCPTDGGMKWKIYDRVTYDNIDSTFKLTCKGSDTTVSNHPTKPQGSCLANGKQCIFPFKDDDGTSYNGCPKYEGRYYWCATSLKTNGVYKVWEHCPEDGSCPLLDNDDSSTPAALPKPTTKHSESPETTPSVKWEPGTTSFYISDGNNNFKCEISFEFNANKKTEFKAISSTCSESKKQEAVMQYVGKHNFSLISKEGVTLECFVGAAIARGDLCQTVLEDSINCDAKSDETCKLGTKPCPDFRKSRCQVGVCVPCTTSNDCNHIEGADICDLGLCTCKDDTKCGKDKRCLPRAGDNGAECSFFTEEFIGCKLRSFIGAYKKFVIQKADYHWTSIWSQQRKSATFSHVKVTNIDKTKLKISPSIVQTRPREPDFVPDPWAKVSYTPFIGYVGKQTIKCEVKMPFETYYNGLSTLGYDRGHLLAEQLMKTLFSTESKSEISRSEKAMMNIFPQNKNCNQGLAGTAEFWYNVEADANEKAKSCLSPPNTKNNAFYITHALIPTIKVGDTFPFTKPKDLGYSSWVLTNYCCINNRNSEDHERQTVSSRVILTSNPLKTDNKECIGFDSQDFGDSTIWDLFVDFAEGKYDDLDGNVANHINVRKDIFNNVCLMGFKNQLA